VTCEYCGITMSPSEVAWARRYDETLCFACRESDDFDADELGLDPEERYDYED